MRQISKRIGIGSTSLLLCIVGLLFSSSFGDKGCYGDRILEFIGLKAWSNGNSGLHYTVLYSFIFFIPAVVIGHKFKNHIGATVGKVVALIIMILSVGMISLNHIS